MTDLGIDHGRARRRIRGGRRSSHHVAPLALCALVAGCSGSEGEEPATPEDAGEELITPEQAAERAARAIDAENADAELERLKREIGQDG